MHPWKTNTLLSSFQFWIPSIFVFDEVKIKWNELQHTKVNCENMSLVTSSQLPYPSVSVCLVHSHTVHRPFMIVQLLAHLIQKYCLSDFLPENPVISLDHKPWTKWALPLSRVIRRCCITPFRQTAQAEFSENACKLASTQISFSEENYF